MTGEQNKERDPECLALFERLSEYIDGELAADDCAHLEAHLADCPPCIEFLKCLRQSVTASHEFSAEVRPGPVPPEMEQRLRQAWQAALEKRAG